MVDIQNFTVAFSGETSNTCYLAIAYEDSFFLQEALVFMKQKKIKGKD